MGTETKSERPTRRDVLLGAGAWSLMQAGTVRAFAGHATAAQPESTTEKTAIPKLPHARPPVADRKFTSPAVEDAIATLQRQIGDPALRILVENCLPNTLDTTVYPGVFDKHPDTYVVTGDIDAMWLRDSSAQVWPYLRLAHKDARLRTLLEGVVRRQARMIQLDPYANAFTRDTTDPPLSWAANDRTEHHAGVAERKWEIDSLCFPIRLAHGYWQATGDAGPFDAQWRAAAEAILRTFTEQQRKQSQGPYSFQRKAESPYDTQGLSGFGNPARPNDMIFSMFRPSDDACIFPLSVPSNLFATKALGQLAELAAHAAQDTALAARASALSDEVAQATARHGRVNHPQLGEIWAYEVDGYGSHLLMDDANAPGLVTLAYLAFAQPAMPCISARAPLRSATVIRISSAARRRRAWEGRTSGSTPSGRCRSCTARSRRPATRIFASACAGCATPRRAQALCMSRSIRTTPRSSRVRGSRGPTRSLAS